MRRDFTWLIFPLLVCVAMALPVSLRGFTPDSYARTSVLAGGKWVKVGVARSGVCFISARELRSLGFSDPASVRIHGYGGHRISDVLSADTYTDDMPQVPALRSGDGVWFYAVGPDEWTEDASGRLTRSLNPYSQLGYYFITEGPDTMELRNEGDPVLRQDACDVATAAVVHEIDKVSYGSSGTLLLGEDLRLTPTRSFQLPLPGRQKGSEIWIRCGVATLTSAPSRLTLTAAGQNLSPEGGWVIPAAAAADYGVLTPVEAAFSPAGDASAIDIVVKLAASGLVHSANLDAVTVNYQRVLSFSDGYIEFSSPRTAVRVADAGPGRVHVWDITSPAAPLEMNLSREADGSVAWVNPYTGPRRYAAWAEEMELVSVESHEPVAVQDLHSRLSASSPAMIIVHAPGLRAQAERIASLHRELDGMDVMVADQRQVFNEFGSGSPDPGAVRRMLKMAYDCGKGQLQYALLIGRGWFDNRGLTAKAPVGDAYRTPVWQSEESLHEYTTYTTDDYLAFLDDNSGLRPASDRYCIALGRIPARSAEEADNYVDKLEKYLTAAPEGEWRNRVLLLADDGDYGIHMSQSEHQAAAFATTHFGRDMLMEKVYLDTWPVKGGVCEEGRARLHKQLDDGVVWWNYVGHANKYYLSSQGVMTLPDITSLANRKWPVFFGATCYFMQWDAAEQSGAEKLFFNRSGGVIAAISATRPVFISENGMLGKALAAEAFRADASGRAVSIGQALCNAKNSLASPRGTSNTNKLRFVLMGDPAFRPAIGECRVSVSEIDGMVPGGDEDIVLPGRHTAVIEGLITDIDGEVIGDFNGTVSATLYDAEYSTLTLGRNIDGTEGRQTVYEQHGERLCVARDTVIAGRWSMAVTVPEEIADNYRPAVLSLYAHSDYSQFATGSSGRFYLSGIDYSQPADTVGPAIESLYIGTPDFVSGMRVGSDPMVMARITDNIGISLSAAGVGRLMSIRLDGRESLTDVASYFTPLSDGTPGGTIAYPLEGIADGHHSLTFTVFDTSGNMARQTIEFVVDSQLSPEIFDIYTDATPASVEVNFFLSHNRPDARLTVCFSVYNLMGHLVWTSTVTDRSDMFTSAPVKWNLTDRAGNRVSRGIYIYRAEIINGKSRTLSKAKKIAVSAP